MPISGSDIWMRENMKKGDWYMHRLFKSHPVHNDVELHTMEGNRLGKIPFYIRRYTRENLTRVMHQHEMLQINYVVKGSCRHFINGKENEVAKGDVLIIPPYVPHQLSCDETDYVEIYEVEFLEDFVLQNAQDFDDVQSLFDFAYLKPFFLEENEVLVRYHIPPEQQKRIETILQELLAEFGSSAESRMLMIKGLLLQFLVMLQRCIGSQGQGRKGRKNGLVESIEKAVEFIDEHFAEDISAQAVAHMAAFSKSYFGYLFKTVTHQTFIEYLNERRIEAALQMLDDSNKRVIDICYDCGFKNVSHFNRTFKNAIGVSPTEYRIILSEKGKEKSNA